jgi:hypothetical protein
LDQKVGQIDDAIRDIRSIRIESDFQPDPDIYIARCLKLHSYLIEYLRATRLFSNGRAREWANHIYNIIRRERRYKTFVYQSIYMYNLRIAEMLRAAFLSATPYESCMIYIKKLDRDLLKFEEYIQALSRTKKKAIFETLWDGYQKIRGFHKTDEGRAKMKVAASKVERINWLAARGLCWTLVGLFEIIEIAIWR